MKLKIEFTEIIKHKYTIDTKDYLDDNESIEEFKNHVYNNPIDFILGTGDEDNTQTIKKLRINGVFNNR